jgi:hypothetical protein
MTPGLRLGSLPTSAALAGLGPCRSCIAPPTNPLAQEDSHSFPPAGRSDIGPHTSAILRATELAPVGYARRAPAMADMRRVCEDAMPAWPPTGLFFFRAPFSDGDGDSSMEPPRRAIPLGGERSCNAPGSPRASTRERLARPAVGWRRRRLDRSGWSNKGPAGQQQQLVLCLMRRAELSTETDGHVLLFTGNMEGLARARRR